jgi:hypothetical protein
MATEKSNIPSTELIEESIVSKPKYQAILSLIAHFQQHKKHIQRAHLIRALVKNTNLSSSQKDIVTDRDKKMIKSEEHLTHNQTITKKQNVDDHYILEGIIDRLQSLGDIAPKIMFNSTANLDKTIQHLRKLGLITNQYKRGYPRIILTEKGHILFYSLIYPGIIFQTIVQLINKLH